MAGELTTESVSFYPVVHLLTGPPGLTRNGGIWKQLKAGLRETASPPSLMVQALHFVPYNISVPSWQEWFASEGGASRLLRELDATIGAERDIFVDSGGFQLLYSDKIDLSRWGLQLGREDVLGLQLRYSPQRIASLDYPISPKATGWDRWRLTRKNIANAVWLAESLPSYETQATPYLAVHGRSPEEVTRYADRLKDQLPRGWLRRSTFGLALGSQVPLSRKSGAVLANAEALLTWMDLNTSAEAPLHIFGVGDPVVGSVLSSGRASRPVSYDNSTYIQNAFRLRSYDTGSNQYADFDPYRRCACECVGCRRLSELGPTLVTHVLSKPPYSKVTSGGREFSRSDVLALIGLHNLCSWKARVAAPRPSIRAAPWRADAASSTTPARQHGIPLIGYSFPLAGFERSGANLLLLPCSKGRPYAASRSHRRILTHLMGHGFREGAEFDRVTLSGLYGPVHWRHESLPPILSYDFPLGRNVSERHLAYLRLRTANVLNVLRHRYKRIIALLHPKAYLSTFGTIATRFSGQVVDEPHEICKALS